MNQSVIEEGSVKVDRVDGVAHVEFFHPMSNSLPGKLLSELTNTITELGTKDDVMVIVLRSSGEKAFCAGASFEELSSIQDLEQGKKFFSGLPSPAAAMTIISFVLFEFETYGTLIHFKWLTATSIIVSYLMVSRVKYKGFPVMFKKGEKFLTRNIKIIAVILFVFVVVKFKMSLLFPLMAIFVLSGIVGNIIEKMKSEDKEIEKEVE